MKTTISVKRQVSVPKALCEKLNLRPGAQIVWDVVDGKLIGHPLPPDGWRSLIGKHKAGGNLVGQLLAQRKEDRERENTKLAR